MGESWITNGTEFPVGPLGESVAAIRAVLVNRLRGNGGHRGAGEMADDVLGGLGLAQVGWLCAHGRFDDTPCDDDDQPVYTLGAARPQDGAS